MMDTVLVMDVLTEAIERYSKLEIFNSDQGSQYTSFEHTSLLKRNGIQISMNGKGRPIDNIAIERFFRTLKYDEIYINKYSSISELRKGIDGYINFYNNDRFHLALDYDKPMNVYWKGVKQSA